MKRSLPFLLALTILVPSLGTTQGPYWAVFRPDNSSLAFSSVYAVADDFSGRTWFGGAGLSVVGPRDDQWARYTAATSPLPSDRVNDLTLGPDGRVWIATSEGAAGVEPDGTGWELLTTRNGLPTDAIQVIRVAGNGDLWIGTNRGVSVRSRDGRVVTYSAANSGLPGDEIRDILLTPSGDVWLATNAGLAVLRVGGRWETFNRFRTNLPGDDVRGLAQDSRQDIWVATWGGGAARLAPDGSNWLILNRETSGLPDLYLTGVAIGPEDTPWFGTANSGILNYEPFRGSWRGSDAATLGLTSNTVTDLQRGRGRALWAATLGGAALYNPDGPRRPAFAATPTIPPSPTPLPPTATRRPTETPHPTGTPGPGGGAGTDSPADSYEPNDRPERAFGPLTPGVAYPSYLTDPADRDYFWFELPTAGLIQLRLREIPAGAQYGLYLLGPDRRIVSSATNDEGGGRQAVESLLIRHSTERTGRYTALVWSPVGDWSLDRPYLLDLSLQSGSEFRPAEVGSPGPNEAAATWTKTQLAAAGYNAGSSGEQPTPAFLRPAGQMAYALAPLQQERNDTVTRQTLVTWLVLRRAYPDAEWLTAIFPAQNRYLYYFFARASDFDAWWQFETTDATFFNQTFYRVYDLQKKSWTDVKTFDNKDFGP